MKKKNASTRFTWSPLEEAEHGSEDTSGTETSGVGDVEVASSTSAGGRGARAGASGGGVGTTGVGLAAGALELALDDVAVAREGLEVRADVINVALRLDVEGTTDVLEALKGDAEN